MNNLKDLHIMLQGDSPIILLESQEEIRLVDNLSQMCLNDGTFIFKWSATEGMCRVDIDLGLMTGTDTPEEVLRHIKSTTMSGVYILLDFHPYLDDPIIIRLLKEIAQNYEKLARTIVFISHALNIPAELKHLSAKFEIKLPDIGVLKRMIKEEAHRWQDNHPHQKLRADRKAVESLINHLLGTTSADARRLIRAAIENDGAITSRDIPTVMEAKYKLLNKDDVISYEYDTTVLSNVAGLDKLKTWLKQRKVVFEKATHGLDSPKGIMLLGVQGCGKSLAAKAVAGLFEVPLLRLDFGALYNKFIGETEKNLRKALETAETMSPCVVWIDEIEKGLSGDSTDGGVSQRVLGTLLTWMVEHRGKVFIVATANDIHSLPPELIRKGRLDEVFFVDLPNEVVREKILEIHLRQRNQLPSHFKIAELVEATEGFSGAEIEQAIVSALYTSMAEEQKLNQEVLLHEIAETRPLSILMAEKINALRHWAKDRTVSAS